MWLSAAGSVAVVCVCDVCAFLVPVPVLLFVTRAVIREVSDEILDVLLAEGVVVGFGRDTSCSLFVGRVVLNGVARRACGRGRCAYVTV